MSRNSTDKLIEYVQKMPQPGSGNCHRYIIGAVAVGRKLGLEDQLIHDTILGALIRPGPTTSQQIIEAMQRCKLVPTKPEPTARIKEIRRLGTFAEVLSRNEISQEEVIERSPIKLTGEPTDDAQLMLQTLFSQDDLLYIGERTNGNICSTKWWCEHPEKWGEFIIPNPLDGVLRPTMNGSMSKRSDQNLVGWKFAVAEFDHLPISKQLAIWTSIELPIAAVISSAGRSIHAWIYVNVDRNNFKLVRNMYDAIIIPLGGDPACRNPSRLSRMPGVLRREKQKMQQLLWLKNPADL